MKKYSTILLIVAQFLFLVCNIIWPFIGNDPRYYFVPLALLLVAFNYDKSVSYDTIKRKQNKYHNAFIQYFLWLSFGNVIKMIFLTNEKVTQANDYVWGGALTLILIYKLWTTGNGSRSNNS